MVLRYAGSFIDCPDALLGRVGTLINRKLNSGVDYRLILDDIFNFLQEYIPFDRIGIALLSSDKQNVSLKWVKSKECAHGLTVGYSSPLRGSSLEEIFKTRNPRIINNLEEYGRLHPRSESTRLVLNDGILSSLTCPLISDSNTVGFVFFSSVKADTYQKSHIDLFTKISEELSVLIGYGNMHHLFEMQHSNNRFYRSVIHELKSPLSIIQSFMDLLNDAEWYRNLDQSGKMLFEILQRNVKAMNHLVTSLSEEESLKRKCSELQLEPVNLERFLHDISYEGRVTAAAKLIEFASDIDPDLPETWLFDDFGIKQVLMNLITNAVKFSNSHTMITLECKAQTDRLVFSVKDQGLGIPNNEMGNLFQDFSKISVKPTAGEPSSGLGLGIVKRIIDSHQGGISVQSEVGVGSTFSFWIPKAVV